MTRVATYVFIDLETTGLPKEELNKTRITELSMVVVSRRHVLETRPGAAPRVLNKLTMCFNPRRMIGPISTDTSGLCNDLLEHQTDFNLNVFNIINQFLQCHEKPVCMVAQNGHSFDFPILKNHFEKLNVSLSDDILCADSLHGFYDILELGMGEDKPNNVADEVDNSITNAVKRDASLSDQAKNDKQLCDKLFEETKTRSDDPICNDFNTQLEESVFLECFNENNILNNQLSLQQQNEKTPKTTQKLPMPSALKNKNIRRQLFYDKNQKPTCSYKLKNIYERVQQRPAIEAHRAENDCIMAMEISVSIGKRFVEWVDLNNCKFSEVKAMRLGVPLGLLVLTGVLWGCTNPFIRQGTKGLRDVTATTLPGQVWAEVTFLLGNWKYVLPWLVNQAGSLSYLAAVQRAPLSVAVPTANSLAFVCTAVTGAGIGAEEPLDARSIVGIVLIMTGTALCCFEETG